MTIFTHDDETRFHLNSASTAITEAVDALARANLTQDGGEVTELIAVWKFALEIVGMAIDEEAGALNSDTVAPAAMTARLGNVRERALNAAAGQAVTR